VQSEREREILECRLGLRQAGRPAPRDTSRMAQERLARGCRTAGTLAATYADSLQHPPHQTSEAHSSWPAAGVQVPAAPVDGQWPGDQHRRRADAWHVVESRRPTFPWDEQDALDSTGHWPTASTSRGSADRLFSAPVAAWLWLGTTDCQHGPLSASSSRPLRRYAKKSAAALTAARNYAPSCHIPRLNCST